jgi:hypothetical protein
MSFCWAPRVQALELNFILIDIGHLLEHCGVYMTFDVSRICLKKHVGHQFEG